MIQQVRARLQGQWVTLTYDPTLRGWKGTLTPDGTSFHQPGGYFNIEVEAQNDTGQTATADGSSLQSLRLTVNERQPPVLTLISPEQGYVTTNQPTVTFTAVDETGGSGVDPESLAITLDGAPATGAAATAIAGGYRIVYTPAGPLAEGSHALAISIKDYDGNTGRLALAYTVDTIPPALTLKEPRYRTVVDTAAIEVAGTATDITQPVTVQAWVNGVMVIDEHPPYSGGGFRWDLPLTPGGNQISVTARDGAGLESQVQLFIIRLITQRTQAHVDALRALLALPLNQWGMAQRQEYLAAACWGAYNYTDLNRVTLAAAHLAEKFAAYGYQAGLEPVEPAPGRSLWEVGDFPRPALMNAYLGNIRRLRDMLAIPLPLPESMEALGYEDANRLERVLVALDAYSPYMDSAFYAGEIYAGEF